MKKILLLSSALFILGTVCLSAKTNSAEPTSSSCCKKGEKDCKDEKDCKEACCKKASTCCKKGEKDCKHEKDCKEKCCKKPA